MKKKETFTLNFVKKVNKKTCFSSFMAFTETMQFFCQSLDLLGVFKLAYINTNCFKHDSR